MKWTKKQFCSKLTQRESTNTALNGRQSYVNHRSRSRTANMSITRILCGVRPLCRVSMFDKMAASWCLIQITPEHARTLKFKANTNMSLSHVDTGAAYAYHPMTRLTLVSFYCALKKQVLRFTSVYLMRAGYLFAFLFYPLSVTVPGCRLLFAFYRSLFTFLAKIERSII